MAKVFVKLPNGATNTFVNGALVRANNFGIIAVSEEAAEKLCKDGQFVRVNSATDGTPYAAKLAADGTPAGQTAGSATVSTVAPKQQPVGIATLTAKKEG